MIEEGLVTKVEFHNECDNDALESASLVFVYGTLRCNECNHAAYLANSEQVSDHAFLAAQLWDTGLGYPAVLPDDQAHTLGELYRVTPEVLGRLDELEDYYGPGGPNEYERVEAEIDADGQHYRAWVYVYLAVPSSARLIASGDWCAYRRARHTMEE
ncbi:gamma-glutamylcyclotransferase family protein [Paenibacillus daejeonensis]|uniref:gamma-glutamylcyclotransferase family protein n=1 Tax=Paenibacillus daejeonensis TaxID=135193 RepID=UPI0003708DEC|nr:gamma-glutamylcyclotransferase [Paenibacillus daejeonensis]